MRDLIENEVHEAFLAHYRRVEGRADAWVLKGRGYSSIRSEKGAKDVIELCLRLEQPISEVVTTDIFLALVREVAALRSPSR